MSRAFTFHMVKAYDANQFFSVECAEYEMVWRIVFDEGFKLQFGIKDFLFIGGAKIFGRIFQTRQAGFAIDSRFVRLQFSDYDGHEQILYNTRGFFYFASAIDCLKSATTLTGVGSTP